MAKVLYIEKENLMIFGGEIVKVIKVGDQGD